MENQILITSLFSLSLVIFSTLASPCVSELCNPSDKKVLLQIKKAFNDPYVLTSWKPDTDCCTEWYCVTCADGGDHRIDSLSVVTGSLSGSIPPEIGDLPYLESLDLHKQANLTGPIPKEITKLKRLKSLRLSWNNLTGPVPDFLSKLTNLTFIELSFNNFSGQIPGSLAKLPNLRSLRLDRNRLTGPIPDSFGEFQAEDFYLVLSHNQISGQLPTSLAKRTDFSYIDLSRNKLTGDASFLFGPNRTAQIVDLSRNILEFDLTKVKFQEALTYLDLNHNKIFGSLSPDLTKLNLQLLNVSYNRLCGKIPVGGALQGFDSTAYFHNRCLCGAPLVSCK